jgi:ribosome-associated heat shock protein Hsp15
VAESRQRLDKWLWFARLTKSRTLAQKLILAGGIRINRQKAANAAVGIKPDDVLTIALDSGVRVVRILAMGTRRGPAAEARLLYADLTPPGEPAPDAGRRGPRPTKRDRRNLDRVVGGDLDSDGFSGDAPASANPMLKRSPP